MLRTLRNLAVANFTGPALTLLSAPLLARGLGADDRGRYAAIMATLLVVTAIFTAGIPETVAYFWARTRGLSQRISCALLFTISVLGVTTFISVAVLIADAPLHAALAVSPVLAMAPLVGARRGILQARGDFRPIIREALATNISRSALITVLFIPNALTLNVALLCTSASSLIGGIMLIATRSSRTITFTSDRRPGIIELASFNAKATAGGITSYANARLDQIYMTGVVPFSALGAYAVAVSLSELVMPVFGALRSIVFSRAVSRGKHDADLLVTRLVIPTTACLIAGLYVMCWLLLPAVFGEEYRAALIVLPLLAIATIPQCFNSVAAGLLSAANKPHVPAVAQFLGGICLFAVLVITVPRWGIQGAAVASLIGYAATSSLMLVGLARTYGAPVRRVAIFSRADLRTIVSRLRKH